MGLLGPSVGRIFDRFGGRVLVIPGSAGIVVALGMLTQVGLATRSGWSSSPTCC